MPIEEDQFFSTLQRSLMPLSDFIAFSSIEKNVGHIENKLNQINDAIISKGLIDGIVSQCCNDSSFHSILGCLIAIRKVDETFYKTENGITYNLSTLFKNEDGLKNFLNGTQFKTFFDYAGISNLRDYIYGVEVGLNSHARKNRNGKLMRNEIKKHLENAKLRYATNVSVNKLNEKISEEIKDDIKNIDFVISENGVTFLVKTNFYTVEGSKQIKDAALCDKIAKKLKNISGVQFIWLVDGKGCESARTQIVEASKSMKIFNLNRTPNFISFVKGLDA